MNNIKIKKLVIIIKLKYPNFFAFKAASFTQVPHPTCPAVHVLILDKQQT
jgi:hypothetical protein